MQSEDVEGDSLDLDPLGKDGSLVPVEGQGWPEHIELGLTPELGILRQGCPPGGQHLVVAEPA